MSECLYSLLQKSARDEPRRTAISYQGTNVSYAELLDLSGRFSVCLKGYDIGPGCRVAFSCSKSVEALIALFGIIRTGATYVPLDPSWPADRVETICRDAQPRFWVGTNPPPAAIPIPSIAMRAAVANSILIAEALASPAPTFEPVEPVQDVANVLYTSGSTGKPKGVQITATSLLHFSQWAAGYFELNSDDRISNHAPYNFDLSTFDIFAAVRSAAAMCPLSERTKMLPYQTAKWMADEKVSVWYSVPSALAIMTDKLALQTLPHLRHVIFAGEVMPKPVLKSLASCLPHATLTNLYGPTETNVCTYYRATSADVQSDDSLPIGDPIDDTLLWVVDDGGRAVNGDGIGELLVAGPTVTSGYFGDANLTSAKLVAAPDGHGHAYRTGDAVSRSDDGRLLFHGRLDRMIKCRGHRVEPGEIEAVLCRHHAVQEAAVVPIPDEIFSSRIKACVAVNPTRRPTEAELLAFCREYLPAYMLPEVWSVTESLPRTDRGKIDLQALARE